MADPPPPGFPNPLSNTRHARGAVGSQSHSEDVGGPQDVHTQFHTGGANGPNGPTTAESAHSHEMYGHGQRSTTSTSHDNTFDELNPLLSHPPQSAVAGGDSTVLVSSSPSLDQLARSVKSAATLGSNSLPGGSPSAAVSARSAAVNQPIPSEIATALNRLGGPQLDVAALEHRSAQQD